jgi:hypothetical protein
VTDEKVTFPPMRRLGVENWTPEDFAEDARRAKAGREAYEARKKALTDRGWRFRRVYIQPGPSGFHEVMGDELIAVDPVTRGNVAYNQAFVIQEEREPGSIPPWPKFDNDWKPPPSTEGLFNIGKVRVMPMLKPAASIFFMGYKYKQQAAEDQAVFDALDAISGVSPLMPDTAESLLREVVTDYLQKCCVCGEPATRELTLAIPLGDMPKFCDAHEIADRKRHSWNLPENLTYRDIDQASLVRRYHAICPKPVNNIEDEGGSGA